MELYRDMHITVIWQFEVHLKWMQQTILSKQALQFNYEKYKEATRSLRGIEEPVPSGSKQWQNH